MTDFDRTNTGVLFNERDRKTNPKAPDYKGSINIEGKEYWLASWIKDGQKGKFMSLSVTPKDERQTPAPAQRTAQKPVRGVAPDFDDESIPF